MRRDGVILHRRTEFVPDLFVDCLDDFFAGEHKKTFRCSFTYAGQQNRQSAIENAKAPRSFPSAGLLFWRRPTLAQPIVALPSGLQRFTSVFGMGTGGTTALLSPEDCAGFGAIFWRR